MSGFMASISANDPDGVLMGHAAPKMVTAMNEHMHLECEICELLRPLLQITSQRLLDQSQAGVYRGKCHIPPHFGLFGPIRVPYPKGLNC